VILNLIGSILFFSLYLFWLVFSLALAAAGLFLPIKSNDLKADSVKESDTICKALYSKSKLTAEEYAFETDQVAVSYDDLIFKGYGFIVAPVIWMLKNNDIIDSSLLFLVHRWMAVHHYKFKTENANKTQVKPANFDLVLTKFCVSVAKGTGKSLSLFV